MRYLICILLLLAVPALGVSPGEVAANERTRCFTETTFCIDGEFLSYWERNGGLEVFGYPISAPYTAMVEGSWTGLIQWFERDRLEYHEAEGVLAGRLGAHMLELKGQPWQTMPGLPYADEGCVRFPETQHTLCEPFLSYWRNNGGLPRFGYPLGEPMYETIGNWTGTVQYFERRRMEHHTELAGTRYEVLLGLLGRDVLSSYERLAACPTQPFPELRAGLERTLFWGAMGCPTKSFAAVPAAAQNFQSGAMFWMDLGNDGKKIVVLFNGGTLAPYAIYSLRDDTWQEGEPVNGGRPPPPPPPGFYEPQRGFGKIWREGRGLAMFIGYATEPERADLADVQLFEGGGLALRLHNANTIYIFGPTSSQLLEYRP